METAAVEKPARYNQHYPGAAVVFMTGFLTDWCVTVDHAMPSLLELFQFGIACDVSFTVAWLERLLMTPVLRYSEEQDFSTFDPALRSNSEPASGDEIRRIHFNGAPGR